MQLENNGQWKKEIKNKQVLVVMEFKFRCLTNYQKVIGKSKMICTL